MYARSSVKTLVLFATMLITGMLCNSVKGQTNNPPQNPHSFTGTWIVQAQLTNCAGTTVQSFSKLLAINGGGTALETSNAVPPSARTTAFGVWEHVGHRNFVYALRFFTFSPTGTFATTVNAKWDVWLGDDGNSYTGTGAIQIVSPGGTVIANLCGTETGTRMVIPE